MTEYFNTGAANWDTKARADMAAGIWKCMSENMAFNDKMRAADLGAGTGLLSVELAKKTAHVTAVDSSGEMLAVLRQAPGGRDIKYRDIDARHGKRWPSPCGA